MIGTWLIACRVQICEGERTRIEKLVDILWFFPYWFRACVCEMVMAATIKAAAIRLGSIKTRC